jgi:V8-like Glu-specific endopeptidase
MNDFLFYKHTTTEGNSGGPLIMVESNNEYKLIGIHKGATPSKNYGIIVHRDEPTTKEILN